MEDANQSRINDPEASESEEKESSSSTDDKENSFKICGVTKKTAIAARILLFAFIVITMTSLLLLIYHQDEAKTEVLMQHHLKLVKKSDWSLKSEYVLETKKESIPERVYVNATSTQTCLNESECVQLLQTIEMERTSLERNFLISSDGTVFEDAGWTSSKRIFISFIANATTIPSTASLEALKQLLGEGVEKGNLDKNYKLFANKSFKLLNDEIQKSPHSYSLESWLSD